MAQPATHVADAYRGGGFMTVSADAGNHGVRAGGSPVMRGNRINRNGGNAVYVHDGGRGAIEDNDLTGNGLGPWRIDPDCEPDVARARNKEE
jgi:parallel beta-helix repeat protein